jgi:hippurate hydrolase
MFANLAPASEAINKARAFFWAHGPLFLYGNSAETNFIADVAADLVGEAHVDRNRSLITAAEDFANMLEVCPGAFINISNAGAIGSCPVHNPHYGFNDAALPIGASLFARLVEKKLARLSGS